MIYQVAPEETSHSSFNTEAVLPSLLCRRNVLLVKRCTITWDIFLFVEKAAMQPIIHPIKENDCQVSHSPPHNSHVSTQGIERAKKCV